MAKLNEIPQPDGGARGMAPLLAPTGPAPMNPIFVVGSPRSGTTLMQSLLNALPAVAVPPEEDLILPLLEKCGTATVSRACAAGDLCDLILSSDSFQYWHVPREEVLACFGRCPDSSVAELVAIVSMAFARRVGTGKRRWGAKVPFYVNHLRTLAQLYPDLRVIHMIRDGRDVLLSMRDRVRQGASHFATRVEVAALRWSAQVARGERAGRDLGPERYLEVGYEQLVSHPRDTLERVCRFVDEPFTEQIFGFYANTVDSQILRHDTIQNYLLPSIMAARVGRWKSELTAAEIMVYEALAGTTLAWAGYTLQFPRKPAYQRARGWLLRALYGFQGLRGEWRRRRSYRP